MKMVDHLSVVLACYNGEKTLEHTLESVNNQKQKLELVFIDDGSSDSSLSILKKFNFNTHVSLQVISRENKGFQYSLHEGVQAAKGKYIARIDADDIWKPNHLDLILKQFHLNENLVLVGSNAEVIDSEGNFLRVTNQPQTNREIIKYLHKDSPFIHSSVVFKRSAYFKTSGYFIGSDLHSMHIADYNLWFELSKFGECLNISEHTVIYRESDESMSRKLNKDVNYKARYWVMQNVNSYYKNFQIYSFIQSAKVLTRIMQYKITR